MTVKFKTIVEYTSGMILGACIMALLTKDFYFLVVWSTPLALHLALVFFSARSLAKKEKAMLVKP